MLDEVIEYKVSFTCARILIDSYQWEPIRAFQGEDCLQRRKQEGVLRVNRKDRKLRLYFESPSLLGKAVGETQFDVFLKEFGKKIYSCQAYPTIMHEKSLCYKGAVEEREVERSGTNVVLESVEGLCLIEINLMMMAIKNKGKKGEIRRSEVGLLVRHSLEEGSIRHGGESGQRNIETEGESGSSERAQNMKGGVEGELGSRRGVSGS
ncbi:hypothetical protein PIB30_011314 [Stylosanthes scabra]|uniref:Uncharacterized protein n=1 Tax=Stylosanthes scabra TaxID=79078 RepID=A0ABU6W6X4_9FABA|nr:hypothetical protein [Stylosanthes scabra]